MTDLADVLTVQSDAAPLDVIEPEEKPDDGALPRPRRTHLREEESQLRFYERPFIILTIS